MWFLLLVPVAAGAFSSPVNVEFIGSAHCGFTARFLRNQVSAVHKMLGPSKRVNITFMPDSMCHDSDRNWLWCGDELNALDACVMNEFETPEESLDIVNCIQLKNGLWDAVLHCIRHGDLQHRERQLWGCAKGRRGRQLLGKKNDITHEKYMPYYRKGFRYPLIFINGERSLAAETNLMGVLCDKYLDPMPAECEEVKRRV